MKKFPLKEVSKKSGNDIKKMEKGSQSKEMKGPLRNNMNAGSGNDAFTWSLSLGVFFFFFSFIVFTISS